MHSRPGSPVCLTGIGAITPFANGWPDTFQAAVSGRVNLAPWGGELDPPSGTARLGLVKDYPKARYCNDRQLRLMDRGMTLSVVAAGLAFEDAQISDEYRARVGDEIATVVASMRGELPARYRFGQPLFGAEPSAVNPAHFPMIAPNTVCGQVALRFGLRGWSTTIFCGEISGLHGLARAVGLVASGRAPIAVVGAYEVFSKFSLHHMRASWQQHGHERLFQAGSNADVPMEGACFFVIESADHAARRGAKPYALLTGATHGYLHAKPDQGYGALVGRHLARAGGADIIVSSLGGSGRGEVGDERGLVTSLREACPGAAELRTRPVFGDGGAQSLMFQVACAAQMLQDRKLEPAFMADDASAGPISRAVTTQLTDRGAYGLLSLECA